MHAGEVHDDGRGFYGDDIDVAFRLLNSPTVKRALRQASMSPLVLVISEEMWYGIVRHGYVKGGPYEQRVQVRVGERRRRGRVHIPVPARSDLPARMARAGTARPGPSLVIASRSGGAERATAGYAALNVREGHRPGPESPGAGRR